MNQIVVAVDGSLAANAAARWAAREAAMRKLELVIVHVAHAAPGTWPQRGWPTLLLPRGYGEDELAQGKKILKNVQAIIAKTTAPRPARITTRLCFGPVVPTLRQFARHPAQMIVVGRRGRGGIHRVLLGSVSSAMVHTAAHCPVAVVHNHSARVELSRAPVVVGIDDSPAGEWATAIAFDEASNRAVELLAVHAVDHADTSQADDLLKLRLTCCQQRYPDVRVHRLITHAHPADALLNQSQYAQLVVVGSRGHRYLTGKLLGSVSAAVVQACRIPVIVARSEPAKPGRGRAPAVIGYKL